MSVYDGARFLDRAIDSVLNQTLADFEFLILDDGSRDDSRAIIERWAARDARIVAITRENRGLVASLNELLARARAPIFARMDADDIAHPDRFAKQHAFLAAHPDHGIVGCWREDIGVDEEPAWVGVDDPPVTHADVLAAIDRGEPVLSHPTVMARTDLMRAAGGYRAAFRHCEDFDLWMRMADMTRIANLPERLLRYRHYPDQVSMRHLTEQQVGAAVARLAHRERAAGRPDPTATLTRLPPIAALDRLFARPGVARGIRADVVPMLLYSPVALGGEGLDIVVQHVRDGGDRAGLWRTVVRMVRFGMPRRALRLAAALLG